MDSKTVSKSHEHGGLADGERFSKMPAATAEQLNLAKILSKQESDAELKKSVSLLQELAKCTEDEAATALYDCENDIQKAVDLLLDKLRSGSSDWHTTGKKARAKHTPVNDSDGPLPARAKGDIRGPDKQKGTVSNARLSQGKYEESSGSPKESDDVVTTKNNRGPKHARKPESTPTESRESLSSGSAAKPPGRSSGLKDQRSNAKSSGMRDGWDPYTEYGEWGGEAIEVVNSNASLAHGLQTELAPADELFLDTNKPTQGVSSTLTTESSLEALSPKSTLQSDEDSLFISKACSKPPGPAFSKLPNVPVFIVPDALPRSTSDLSFKFGDHGASDGAQSTAAAILSTGRNLSSTAQSDLESQLYSGLTSHRTLHNFESADRLSADTLVSDKKTDAQAQHVIASNQYQNVNVAPKSPSTFTGDPSAQAPAATFNSDRLNAQTGFLESSLKNYLLDNLPNDLGKLSVVNSGLRNEPTSQFPLPASSQPHGQPGTGPSVPQQINKPHMTTHGSFHSSQQPLVSSASQQSQTAAATALPPGMTHFISQFAPTPYHMFNSGNAPAVLEQLLHQQHRMFYDMHLHQQAATTAAQSHLTSSSEASTTSKPHAVPGPMNHVTATGAPIRPDMLPSAMGPAPQMLPTGHPFFSYPGFVLMNGYPNAFMNQPQSGADSGGPPHANPNMTQAVSQSSSSQSFSGVKPMNAAYEEFLDMKYGDPSKQVGYKSQSTNFGNFQSHMDGTGSKMSASHSTANGVLNPGFGMNSSAGSGNGNQPFLPQYYPPGVSLNAAVALAQQQHHQSQHQGPASGSAVNQSSGTGGVAATGQPGGQMHQLGNNHGQPLVMGSSGPGSLHHAHHHPSQRPVMSHQH